MKNNHSADFKIRASFVEIRASFVRFTMHQNDSILHITDAGCPPPQRSRRRVPYSIVSGGSQSLTDDLMS